APDEEQARVLDEIERVVDRARAEGLHGAVVGLAAAEAPYGLGGSAEEIEEALAHDLEPGERPIALVIEDAQAAVARARAGQLAGRQIERVIPRDAVPPPRRAAQGMQHAVAMILARLEVVIDLVAERPAREGVVGIAGESEDAAVADLGHDTAGVEAV